MRPVKKGDTNSGYQTNVLGTNTNKPKVTEIQNESAKYVDELKQLENWKKEVSSLKALFLQDVVSTPKSRKRKREDNVLDNELDEPTLKKFKPEIPDFDDNTLQKFETFVQDDYVIKDEDPVPAYNAMISLLEESQTKKDEPVKRIYNNIKSIYPFSRGYLINQIGPYCSYCGMFVRANLAVEHMLPKSEFPNKSVDWDNFLLACTNCNSLKGSKPQKDEGSTPQDVLKLYAWPDRDNTFNGYSYRLCEINPISAKKTGSYTIIDEDTGDEHKIKTSIRDLSDHQDSALTAEFFKNIYLYEGFTMVQHCGVLNVYLNDPPLYFRTGLGIQLLSIAEQKLEKTQVLVELNKYVPNVDVTDRRVSARTMVYFRILGIFADLELLTQSNDPNKQGMIDAYIDQIKDTMSVAGYWSVWKWTIDAYFPQKIKEKLNTFLEDKILFPNCAI